jgi:hypothetical protein
MVLLIPFGEELGEGRESDVKVEEIKMNAFVSR